MNVAVLGHLLTVPATTTQADNGTSPLTIVLVIALFALLVLAGLLRGAVGVALKVAEIVAALGKTATLAAAKAVVLIFGLLVVLMFLYTLLQAHGSA